MLSITIITLLITSNVISSIQAKEQKEQKAQFNGTQTPVYKSDSVIEALFKGFFKGTRSKTIAGSVSIQNDIVRKFDNGSETPIIFEPHDVLIDNKFPDDTMMDSVVVRNNKTYIIKNKNVHYGAQANKDALNPVIHRSGNFNLFGNDSEAGINTKNNTESQVDSAEQNSTDSQGNSSSTNYDSDSSSHIENRALHNKEREAYADKLPKFNRQMRLSSNVFYSLSYFLIILLKYSLF